MPSEYFSQSQLLTKMKAFGYSDKALNGHCYGFSEMAINAYFQGTMAHFRERLRLISTLTEKDIKRLNDLKLFQEKKFHLPIELENGKKISPLELFGFFDGVTLYQRPDDFSDKFEKKTRLKQVDNPASKLLRPQSKKQGSDEDKSKDSSSPMPAAAAAPPDESIDSSLDKPWPKKIENVCGIYNKQELIAIFETLKNNVTVPFSINACSTNHAISLHFDPQKKQWLFIDPNHMPGEEYGEHATDRLAEALLKSFTLKSMTTTKNTCVDLNFYVEHKDEETFLSDFSHAKQEETFFNATKITESRLKRQDDANASWLMIAAEQGRYELVKKLLQEKADINHKKDNGRSALHYACQNGYIEIVKTLIEAGANINTGDNTGLTPLHLAAQFAYDEDIIQTLIDAGADIHAGNSQGITALHLAASSGHENTIKTLMDAGANINAGAKGGVTALHLASKAGHKDTIKLLIAAGADVKQNCHWNVKTTLQFACESGDLATVELILKSGVDINEKTAEGCTALSDACKAVCHPIVEKLIQEGADPNTVMDKQMPPLLYACQHGLTDLVKTLMAKGVDPNVQAENGMSPLHYACQSGHREIVRLLLNKNPLLGLRKKDEGNTPLHLAAKNGHADILIQLMKAGADVNCQSHWTRTPIELAAREGHKACFELLYNNPKTIPGITYPSQKGFYMACQLGHKEIAEKCLEAKSDININEKIDGNTALEIASQEGHLEVVRWLIKNGANPKNENTSPLILAAEGGHFDVVKLLIDSGVEVSLKTGHETTAIYCAVKNGHTEVVKFLLDKGANPNLHDKDYKSPLQAACMNGYTEIAHMLIENGAKLAHQYKYCDTPLQLAANRGHYEIVDDLLTHGASVNDKNIFAGKSALYLALNSGHSRIVERLITAGADVNEKLEYACQHNLKQTIISLATHGIDLNQKFSDGTSLIDYVFKNNLINELGMLIEKGLDIEQRMNGENLTLLSYAAKHGFDEMVTLLIEKGANVNYTNKGLKGWTALHYACQKGHLNIVQQLLNANAELHAQTIDPFASPNQKEYSPLHIAAKYNQAKILEALLTRGATVNQTTYDDETALSLACTSGDLEVIKHLLKAKAECSICPKGGHPPLLSAIEAGKVAIVKLLLNAGADPNQTSDDDGSSAMNFAINIDNPAIVQLLISRGAQYDSTQLLNYTIDKGLPELANQAIDSGGQLNIAALQKKEGMPLLHYYCQQPNNEMVKILLKLGANIDCPAGPLNGTPVLYAAKSNHVDVLKTLLEINANPNDTVYEDGQLRSALYYALQHKNSDMVNLLSKGSLVTEKRRAIRLKDFKPFIDDLDGYENEDLVQSFSALDRENGPTILAKDLDTHDSVLLHLCRKRPTSLTYQVLKSIPIDRLSSIIDRNMTRPDNILQALADRGDMPAVYDLLLSLQDPKVIASIFLGKAHDVNQGNLLTSISEDRDSFIKLMNTVPPEDRVKILLIRNHDNHSVIDTFYQNDTDYNTLLNNIPKKYHGLLELRKEYSKRVVSNKEYKSWLPNFMQKIFKWQLFGAYKAHDKLATLDNILKRFNAKNTKNFGISEIETGAAKCGRFKEQLQALKTACKEDQKTETRIQP